MGNDRADNDHSVGLRLCKRCGHREMDHDDAGCRKWGKVDGWNVGCPCWLPQADRMTDIVGGSAARLPEVEVTEHE